MAYQVIDCGIFCIGDVSGTQDVNTGADVFMGLIYFIVLLVLAVFYALLIVNIHLSMLKKGDAGSNEIGMTNRLTKHEQNGPISISSSAVSISHKNIRDSRDFDVENNSITKIARNNLNVMFLRDNLFFNFALNFGTRILKK